MTIKESIQKVVEEHIKREGIADLMAFLEENDYFSAPASSRFHGANSGGLAKHSYSVYNILCKKNRNYNLGYSEETLAICGLFHDLCKVNFYKPADEPATSAQTGYLHKLSGGVFAGETLTKAYASQLIEHYKNDGTHEEAPSPAEAWEIDDKLPLGHGEKSLFLVQKFIDLTDEEALAIRWHMSAFDPGIQFNYPSGYCFRQASEDVPLVVALFTSDYESDKLMDV